MRPIARVLLAVASITTLAVVFSIVPAPKVAAERIAAVTVANTPLPVSVINTSLPITIAGNSAATPLFVVDVNNPAQRPFSTDCVADTFDPFGRGSCTLGAVPAGKRFVIEMITGQLQLDAGAKPVSVHLQACAAGTSWDHFFPSIPQGSTPFFFGDNYTVTQQVRLYADNTGGCSGNAPFFNMVLSSGTDAFATFTASGYLINVP